MVDRSGYFFSSVQDVGAREELVGLEVARLVTLLEKRFVEVFVTNVDDALKNSLDSEMSSSTFALGCKDVDDVTSVLRREDVDDVTSGLQREDVDDVTTSKGELTLRKGEVRSS